MDEQLVDAAGRLRSAPEAHTLAERRASIKVESRPGLGLIAFAQTA